MAMHSTGTNTATATRRRDTGRPGNGGMFDHTAGGRSGASLDSGIEASARDHLSAAIAEQEALAAFEDNLRWGFGDVA